MPSGRLPGPDTLPQTISTPASQRTKRAVVARTGANTPLPCAAVGAVNGQAGLARLTFRTLHRRPKGDSRTSRVEFGPTRGSVPELRSGTSSPDARGAL